MFLIRAWWWLNQIKQVACLSISYVVCDSFWEIYLKSLRFVKVFSTNKVTTLCFVDILFLLICTNEIIQVTKGQKYFPEGLYVGQIGFGSQAHIALRQSMCCSNNNIPLSCGFNKMAQELTHWWLPWMCGKNASTMHYSTDWWPCSHDSSACDYFLWKFTKNEVYTTRPY
jgi:hypothetical protein